MKESYSEGVANHASPELCGDCGDTMAEALTGEHIGGILNSEITNFRMPTSLPGREGNMDIALKQVMIQSGGVVELGMCGYSMHRSWEVSDNTLTTEKGSNSESESHTTVVNKTEKSDSNIVPKKWANKTVISVMEPMEGRTLTKRNTNHEATGWTQCQEKVLYGLDRVRQKAQQEKKLKFNNLLHHITPELLRKSFYQLKREASAGTDGIKWKNYEKQLTKSLRQLFLQIKQGKYRAQPVKRTYIDKADGRKRPLGITAIEDKIVQHAVTTVLNQIYETDFLGFSYGFRPQRCQHNALDALSVGIERKEINWILDTDIRGFFDAIDHEWLLTFIQHRITDKRILRLIRKWLKTGWIEDGKRYRQEVGTPQGSVISPLLGNIFLHYVFDLWIKWWRKHHARGDVIIVRYADDIIIGFQHQEDAKECYEELKKRFETFGLELHPEKSKLIEFGKRVGKRRKWQGKSKPDTFDFLGFTHICSRNKYGGFFLRRKTIKKRFRKKCQEIKAELKKRMHHNLDKTGKWLRSVITGFQNYYAVPGNMVLVKEFSKRVITMWLNSIRRRSQKGRCWTWEKFIRLMEKYIPRMKVIHPFPRVRFNAKYSR